MLRRRPAPVDLAAVDRAVAAPALPPAVWKTCPWEPRALIEDGLRQPYAAFWEAAYGRFLHHHHPEGGAPAGASAESMRDQLSRTMLAWSPVAAPGEECVLWDLDARVGVEAQIAAVEAHLAAR